ncbi:MAG: hypothetical protein H6739_15725 [Alphaproteobacteria bacterium]|nr:hypothetical protein [Alphaproteobacteria bacterium]MCB9761291.1 hypothetical protein [Alphaproteobacteria bacterium]
MTRGHASLLLLPLALAACRKVPIFDVNAGFSIADAAWFEDEETLFIFYEVTAEQGLGEPSVIEIRYTTDDEEVPWTDVGAFEMVHTHEPVDCGVDSLCGSASIRVPIEPRRVGVRLRYHRDGALALTPRTTYNVVGSGPAHTHRSLLVYGVFNEENTRVQWRGRHVFPTIRNHEASRLGLRRDITVEDQRYGTTLFDTADNPYGYGLSCPNGFTDAGLDTLAFNVRAAFNEEELPIAASSAASVCATTTVHDATGPFTTEAIARKNPETRAAFPLLRSPIHDATPIPFFLAPCRRTISEEHEAMQRQRLLLEDVPTTCIDDWSSAGFVDGLADLLSEAVEAERPRGDDMVLVIGLHRDEAGVADAVEEALALVVPEERHRASPRLAGAFVFDSEAHLLGLPALTSSTLWCPASALSTGGSITCAVAPDFPDLELGPFSFDVLPILTTREDYLEFIDTYSERQAGSVTDYTLRVPEFSATADHNDFGDYGVVTFLNGELFTADRDDAFSYCVQEDGGFYVFRSPFMQSEVFLSQAATFCAEDPEGLLCTAATLGALPIEILPYWHDAVGEETYEVGMFWDFPFLLHMDYETFLAGAVSAFSFSVPFGFGTPGEAYYGSYIWTTETFSLEELLTHCRRYCNQPTFDSAGEYRIFEPFRGTYSATCYQPDFPKPGDSGFPLDP